MNVRENFDEDSQRLFDYVLKYSEIIKNYTFEQLVYARTILDKQKEDLYIQDKELKEEFKRRLELNRGKSLNNKEEF